VQCKGSDYAECGTNVSGTRRVCDSLSQTCSTQLEQAASLCEPCVSDAQCKTGQLCVMQTYDDPTDAPDGGELPVGYFCFWRQDSAGTGAPAGSCANARPFFATESVTSIDGVQASVCGLAVTTCAGYRHFRAESCTGADNDAACGDTRYATDGYCREVGAGSGTYRCTTPCLSDDDCKTGAACNTGSIPNYCNLQ